MPRTLSNGKNSTKQTASSKDPPPPPVNTPEIVTQAVPENRNDNETSNIRTKVWIVQNGQNNFKVFSEEDAINKMKELMSDGLLDSNFSMKMFDTEDNANKFIQSLTSERTPTESNDKQSTATATVTESSSKKRNMFDDLPDIDFPTDPDSPAKKRSNNNTNDSAAIDLVEMMKADMNKKGMRIVVHYFTSLPSSAKYQPLVIEFQDEAQSFNHWLHRAQKWTYVIGYMHENHSSVINKFHRLLYATKCRHPNGEDVPEFRMSKTNRITLYREMFVGYVTSSYNKMDIKEAIKHAFKPLVHNPAFQQCYQFQYCRTSRNQNARTLLASNPETSDVGNNYWAMIDGALETNIKMEPHSSLMEVLMTSDISTVLQRLFGDSISNTDILTKNLDRDVRKFVFND